MDKTVNILLTSAGRRSYLVKYFQEAVKGNGTIHAANSSGISTALEAADKAVVTPSIYDSSYIPFLLRYCRKNKITAVIPLFDIDLLVLSRHRAEFEETGTKLVVSDYKTIDICNDKWRTYNFLKENGFDVLPTFLRLQDAFRAVKGHQVQYPFIVKPRWGMGSIAVYEAENEKELEVLYEKARREIFGSYLKYESGADADHSVLIQARADGQEYGLDNISDLSGNYCATIVRKKEGMRSGETDCATIVAMPEMNALGKRLASATGHIANMDIDVIACGGKSYVLDMNARFGGGYPFSHAAGVNLPLAIVKWLREEAVPSGILVPEIGFTSQKNIQVTQLRRYSREGGLAPYCGWGNIDMDVSELLAKIQYLPLHRYNAHKISGFIKTEIDPFLSIPLMRKLTVPTIEDYAKKLVQRADGYVVSYNGEIYGIIAAYIRNRAEEGRVYLSLLGVAKCLHRHGIGTALLKKVISELPEGCMLYTQVDEKNMAAWMAYQKAGFRCESVQNGRKSIFLVKNTGTG